MARTSRARQTQREHRQAQREQRRQRAEARQRRRRYLYIGVSGAIAFLIIASFVVSALPQGNQVALNNGGANRASHEDDVGEEQTVTPTASHVDGRDVTYSTVPPTSGDHWSFPTQCGVYEQGVADETIVHNLEHGNVVLSYNLTDPAQVERIKQIHEELDFSENWLITRYSGDLATGEVALSVWGIMDKFTGVDEERIQRFYDTYRGNNLSEETLSLGYGIPCTSASRMDR